MKPAFWAGPYCETQMTGRLQRRLRPRAVRRTAGGVLGEGLPVEDGMTTGDGEAVRVELTRSDGVGVTDAAWLVLLEQATASECRRERPPSFADLKR